MNISILEENSYILIFLQYLQSSTEICCGGWLIIVRSINNTSTADSLSHRCEKFVYGEVVGDHNTSTADSFGHRCEKFVYGEVVGGRGVASVTPGFPVQSHAVLPLVWLQDSYGIEREGMCASWCP